MIILRNPQIAELSEAGCAFKSNVIISKNETSPDSPAGLLGKERVLMHNFTFFHILAILLFSEIILVITAYAFSKTK